MFVCVTVAQYKLHHVVGFCKYIFHNISIRFPLFPAVYTFHSLLLVSRFLGSKGLIS
jgi:hypothetical protein